MGTAEGIIHVSKRTIAPAGLRDGDMVPKSGSPSGKPKPSVVFPAFSNKPAAGMISAYNRKELLLGIGSLILSLFGFVCAFLFFRYAPAYVFHSFGVKVAEMWLLYGAVGAILLICVSGYMRWKGKGGFHSYYDSAFYHDLDPSTGGANVVDLYAHRVTAPAYILGQVFLAGPLMLLGGITHFQNRIPPDQLLEHRLKEKLSELRSINSWQPLSAHPGHEDLILMLAKIGRIDFSATRGPRIRAYPETLDDRTSDDD